MSTRAASATLSLRAKQDLVRVLFGAELSKKGPQAHRLLDHSIYSYADLRSYYLEQIQKLHPDKQKSQQSPLKVPHGDAGDDSERMDLTKTDVSRFVELQKTWKRYASVTKISKLLENGESRELEANFTMFGVGCSFSDNEEERELRTKIMDQASRGWFSAGGLGDTENDERAKTNEKTSKDDVKERVELACDDLFEPHDNIFHNSIDRNGSVTVNAISAHRSLVSHLIPPHRR